VDATSGITRNPSIEASAHYHFTSAISKMNETAHHKMMMNYKQDSTPALQRFKARYITFLAPW